MTCRNLPHQAFFYPLLDKLFSEPPFKRPKVRYASTCQEDIANKSVDIALNDFNRCLPSDSFFFEETDKLLCSYHSLG